MICVCGCQMILAKVIESNDKSLQTGEVICVMGYGYGWIFLFVGGLAVIGIIVLIMYALIRVTTNPRISASSAPPEAQQENTSRALAILAERYARGEISDDEYKQKKMVIMCR